MHHEIRDFKAVASQGKSCGVIGKVEDDTDSCPSFRNANWLIVANFILTEVVLLLATQPQLVLTQLPCRALFNRMAQLWAGYEISIISALELGRSLRIR